MAVYQDQLNRQVYLDKIPERIVSLVPSQTELLYDLGLEEAVTGITKFCVHPGTWFRSKTRVGGTKQLDLEKIRKLQPDLIIANKEENVREQIKALAEEFPVWLSDVNTLDDALEMIRSIGTITGRKEKASAIADAISGAFAGLHVPGRPIRAAYLIWRAPYMVAGGGSFISHMMNRAGFENVFGTVKRYPEVTLSDLQRAGCELLLLSSEPFPFAQKHIDELRALLPETKMLLVDGEMFSWYGSRLLKAPAYFQQLQNQILSLSHAAGT